MDVEWVIGEAGAVSERAPEVGWEDPGKTMMRIRFKKTHDGCVLSCIRDDASVEVQRSKHDGFFAMHDLLHFVVETTLGLRESFLGLVESGWSFDTFGDRDDPRYQAMPAEALVTEHLVAILSRRLGDQSREDAELLRLWAEEVNVELRIELEKEGLPPVRIDPARLREIGRRHAELCQRWATIKRGAHLEVQFDPASATL